MSSGRPKAGMAEGSRRSPPPPCSFLLFIFIPGRWPASSARPLTKASAQPPPAYDPDGHGMALAYLVLRKAKICTGPENPLPRPPTAYTTRESSLISSSSARREGGGCVSQTAGRGGQAVGRVAAQTRWARLFLRSCRWRGAWELIRPPCHTLHPPILARRAPAHPQWGGLPPPEGVGKKISSNRRELLSQQHGDQFEQLLELC